MIRRTLATLAAGAVFVLAIAGAAYLALDLATQGEAARHMENRP